MEAAGVNYLVCGVVGLAEVGCDTNCLLSVSPVTRQRLLFIDDVSIALC